MANNIINLILTAAGYILGLFDQMLSETGLFGWFTFCFFTFTVFRFLLVPLFGRGLSVGKSDEATPKKVPMSSMKGTSSQSDGHTESSYSYYV